MTMKQSSRRKILMFSVYAAVVLIVVPTLAQFGPPLRRHLATQVKALRLIPATKQPVEKNRVSIEVKGNYREIRANGIPEHKTGAFPNRGNPHSIAAQNLSVRVPSHPKAAESPIPLGMQVFGVCLNGVPFDPGAAEWYNGDRQGGWQYEALSGAVPLGIDENHAHVQRGGVYHYHGLPNKFLKELEVSKESHSPLIGWAADGFPIYAMYGYREPGDAQSGSKELQPSYRLQKGNRPTGKGQPGGKYDGTFIEDYEYVAGQGDLDECNGRICVTPEFPDGTYAYFLTQHWPVIPRMYRGNPSSDFRRGPGPGGPRNRPPGPRTGSPPRPR